MSGPKPKGTDRSPNSHTALDNEKDGSKDIGDEEWKKRLSAKQFQILRGKGTDPAFKNEYDQIYKEGVYHCAGCDTPLYTSVMKFDCGCGWPGFWDCLPKAVREEGADGRPKEILCNACNGHLGHIFRTTRFNNPINERHCVNSTSVLLRDGKL